jgi:hypothetical protein
VAACVGGKPTVQFSGVNVQIVNGLGKTETINGEGNLVIGYDEGPGLQTGSHDLVLGGALQEFTSFAGILAGRKNAITAPFASVLGGRENVADGEYSSVLGGAINAATDEEAAVVGGYRNTASGSGNVVAGGEGNQANGDADVVSGGSENETGADATLTSVSGGAHNQRRANSTGSAAAAPTPRSESCRQSTGDSKTKRFRATPG